LKENNILTDGLNNWKLRLILSALLCIFGLGAFVSMLIGEFIHLSVYDKSLVSISIFVVGVPAYLIISNVGNIDESTIAGFLNSTMERVDGKIEVLLKSESELSETEIQFRDELLAFFEEDPVHNYLPVKPIKQAYFIFLFCTIASFGIWYMA
jgi:hypothetical protein